MDMDTIESLSNRKSLCQDRIKEISGTPLPPQGQQEAVKVDYHWDILLKEMKWLANDFSNERTRLRNNCKKIAKAIDTHYKTKDARMAKKAKDEVLQLKRIASRNAKEIKKFWIKINKVISFKQKLDADAVKQKAMDKHLVFLVKQTELYTSRLAENMHYGEGGRPGSPASVGESSAASSLRRSNSLRLKNYGEQSDASLGEISDLYSMSEAISGDDESFEGDDADEEDNESTLLEEEALHRDRQAAGEELSYAREVELLKQEGDMSVEELRAMYYGNNGTTGSDSGEDDGQEEVVGDDRMSIEGSSREHESENRSEDIEDTMKRLEVMDATARSYQVEIPYVLSPLLRLRQYQHVGLSWLVSLHERRLNGILADEMGLGKTIQTISLLAYLAVYRGLWGPHLVIVPTSCIVNWEVEFKKWCPVFKILTYYGSTKQRKNLRTGWSKLNSFHVVITSYQLVVQDSSAFKRKRWYYMVLDEAHNIKNFKSQRWQVLLTFNTQRRLLLTGTPLQNNLMELWALMHFLMPHIFRSRKEFSYWFSNPLTGMIEGNSSINSDLINRLHGIMRPFVLRRLKKDVEKQLPGKFEHIVMCKLSRRQQFLYEEFMSRSGTRSLLTGGGFMGMMNVLMQLRKVCNHPDLFEPRPILSPFIPERLELTVSSLIDSSYVKDPLSTVSDSLLHFWNFDMDTLSRDTLSELKVSRAAFMNIHIDDVHMDTPRYLKNTNHYEKFFKGLENVLREEAVCRRNFNFSLNTMRSSKPSIGIVDWRLVNQLTLPVSNLQKIVDPAYSDIAYFELPYALFELVKSFSIRAIELKPMFERFIFVMAKVKAKPVMLNTGKPNSRIATAMINTHVGRSVIAPAISSALSPYYDGNIRQQMYFPDRKMVQFDSGKLQVLCALLHERKQGGHKCLIFTQMSKMLDILEAFLNIHGHTYVRLDGATTVDKRQKLMDRFNNDPKLFCFILSTRSGGFGINLTGADSVIFYDSDWNPAMDAQAQDRAHRIGQTRDVHIYRLVCSSTVEENILIKAKQKQHLDFLVMTEGNFSEASLFNTGSVKDMLGISVESASNGTDNPENVEAAMAAAEDEEDLSAMRNVKEELAKEDEEFDENANPILTSDQLQRTDTDDPTLSVKLEKDTSVTSKSIVPTVSKDATEEEIIEAEFDSWQKKVGSDFNAIQSALKPIERYAYRFNTVIDPYYSLHYIIDHQRMDELAAEASSQQETEWTVAEIEQQKEEDEIKALEDGELIWAPMSVFDVKKLKKWYIRERSKRKREFRRRLLIGEAWSEIIDPVTQFPFWYNEDTGEASYGAPDIVIAQREVARAKDRGYMAMPETILWHIFDFVAPLERMKCAEVCAHWKVASFNERFHLKVLPIEAVASDSTKGGSMIKEGSNDKRNLLFGSISEAISAASAGDTIALCNGHYWTDNLVISVPLRILGCLQDPNKCSLEITGQIRVSANAKSVVLSGLSVTRPRKLPQAKSLITAESANVRLFFCSINNSNGGGCGISIINDSVLWLYSSTVKGAMASGIQSFGSDICAMFSSVSENSGNGICLVESNISASDCFFTKNISRAVRAYGSCAIALSYCDISDNGACPAVSVDEFQDINDPAEDVIVYIRRCTGDVESDPVSRKWLALPSKQKVLFSNTNSDQIKLNAMLGQNIEIFWDADDTWYPGKVESFDANTNLYKIIYGDGCIEHVDLSKEQHRFTDRPDLSVSALTAYQSGSKRSYDQFSQDDFDTSNRCLLRGSGTPRSAPVVSPKTLLFLAQQSMSKSPSCTPTHSAMKSSSTTGADLDISSDYDISGGSAPKKPKNSHVFPC